MFSYLDISSFFTNIIKPISSYNDVISYIKPLPKHIINKLNDIENYEKLNKIDKDNSIWLLYDPTLEYIRLTTCFNQQLDNNLINKIYYEFWGITPTNILNNNSDMITKVENEALKYTPELYNQISSFESQKLKVLQDRLKVLEENLKKPVVIPCGDVRSLLTTCYKYNQSDILKCSNELKAFNECARKVSVL